MATLTIQPAKQKPDSPGFFWSFSEGCRSGEFFICRCFGKPKTAEANALLIAVAPDLLKLCVELVQLCGGWREVIAELDDMPKSEVLGKAMWACLDQIDIWKKQTKAVIAKAEPGILKACDRIDRAKALNAELLAALKAVEFVETNEILEGGGGNYESRCPWCGALGQNPPYWWKHKPDCPRQAAIHRAEET